MSLQKQGSVSAWSSCNLGRGLWWTPATHWLYGPEHRCLVELLFHVANRGHGASTSEHQPCRQQFLASSPFAVKTASSVVASWWPPQEIWNLIASFCVHSREYCCSWLKHYSLPSSSSPRVDVSHVSMLPPQFSHADLIMTICWDNLFRIYIRHFRCHHHYRCRHRCRPPPLRRV